MQSIRVTLFSEKFTPSSVINIPILSYENLVQRVEDIARRHAWIPVDMAWQSLVYCRELFQEKKSDLFFFPSSGEKCVSLAKMNVGEMFFLRASSWDFILCFNPNAKARPFGKPKTAKLFSEDQDYPAGVGEAASFFLSHNHMSILVSNYGSIKMNNDDELVLKGIEVVLLQKTKFSEKSIFVQKKNENVSPNRPLREGIDHVEDLQKYKKYIKVRCVCHVPEFCYSAQFPVLSEKELEKEIVKDRFYRMQIYGSRSHFPSFSELKYYFFQPPSADVKHMIMFPYKMGIDVPFGSFEKGRMFFSHADTTLSEHSSGNFKITFFPSFFELNKNLRDYMGKNVQKHFIGREQTAFSVCGAKKVTTFIPAGINLVQFSPSEYKLDGAKVEMISTKNHGGWGICFSRETINLSNNPIPGPSGVENRETQQKGSRSLVSGDSGKSFYAYGDSFPSLPRDIVSSPPKRHRQSSLTGSSDRMNVVQMSSVAKDHPYSRDESEQQAQQEGSKNSVPGGPGRSSYAYGSSFPSLPRATVFVSPERQGKQTQKRKHSSPVFSGIGSRAPKTQAAATVSVPPDQQEQQTQQRSSSPVPVSSDVSFHPYPYGPHPYGPLPFYGGLYSYRSPIIPHPQAAATVSVPSESENIQRQQEGRSSPLSEPSGIEYREATATFSQAETTVIVPTEQQGQQTQQRSRSPLRDPSEVRNQVIYPTPMRAQEETNAFMQFEQIQQRRGSPVPVTSGISFHSYPQHEPWPFSGGPPPYSYPEIGSFFGGSYPYGSPLPPFPYPAARKGQWMPLFHPSFSSVRPPVRYEIPVQEKCVEHSGKEEASAEVPVGAVQQTPIWRPDEGSSSASPQAQVENFDEDTDIDVEN